MNESRKNIRKSPVAIGGVGGSGTRLVAEIAKKMGIFIGDNINISNDNLSFPKLGKLVSNSSASQEEKGRNAIAAIKDFEVELKIQFAKQQNDIYTCWGWKAPVTFFWLDYFNSQFPDMSYIHVVRHGLDMAFSGNQNQLKARAEFFGIDLANSNQHKAALEYWIKANQLAIEKAQKILGDRFHLINFDKLCECPHNEITRLSMFLSLDLTTNQLEKLVTLVKPPLTIGRYKKINWHQVFDKEQIKAVVEMGFIVEN
jgi:hypothetical protein